MSIGIIIQARMGSTRLANKMILPFYKNESVLELLVLRIKSTTDIPVCIATTQNPIDDAIENLAIENKVMIFRGEENNVLNRFIKASEKFGFDKIIRVCADNPFLDMGFLNKMIRGLKVLDCDYYAFYNNKDMPSILTHYGFWTEGVTLDALKKIEKTTKDKTYLEHVTNYIYKNVSEFTIHKYKIDDKIAKAIDIRLTLDTKEDFLLLQKIYLKIIINGIKFSAPQIIDFIDNNDIWKREMKNNIEKNSK